MLNKGEMEGIHVKLERTRRKGVREEEFMKLARTDLEEEERAKESYRECSRIRTPNSQEKLRWEKLGYSKTLDKVGKA